MSQDNIKLLLTDVDGVLTDGRLLFSGNGEIIQAFCVHDGFGIKAMLQAGINVGILSSRHSSAVSKRMRQLGVNLIWQGIEDKAAAFTEILQNLQLTANDVCYIGDDIPDIPVLVAAGIGVAVANAHPKVAAVADWQTKNAGGFGAVREVADTLLAKLEVLRA